MNWKKAKRPLAVFATVILVFSVVTVGLSVLMSVENDELINAVAGENEIYSEDEEAFFDVEITDFDEEVKEGETLTLEYRVTNTGEAEDTQTIRFYRGVVRLDRSELITLDVDDVYEGEFTWTPGEAREYDLRIESMDDQDEVTVTVTEVKELMINAEEGGTTDPEPGTYSYEPGEEVTVEAIPNEGYEFVEWTGDETSTDTTTTIAMDEDKEITAVFEVELETYELTVNTEAEGTVDIDPDQDEYEEGTEVTLTAEPDEGWEFDEWTGDATGTDTTITITMDEDKEITAVFEEEEPVDDDEDREDIGDIPGFTTILLVLATVIAIAIYSKKEQ